MGRALAVGAGAFTAGSLWLNWLILRGQQQRNWSGVTIEGERWLLWIIAVAAVAAAGMIAADRVEAESVAIAIGSCQISVGVLTILLFEGLPALIPHAIIPKTVRRYALDLGAGLGPWFFVVGGVLLVASTQAHRLSGMPLPQPRVLAASGGLIALEGLMLHLRSDPWLSGHANRNSVAIDGRALPWVGPITLLVCLVCLLATAAFILSRRALVLLIASATTWFGALAATIVLVPTAAAHRIDVPGLRTGVVGASARPSCWIFAVLSIALGASIAYIVAQEG